MNLWPWAKSPEGWRRLFRGEAEAPTRFMLHIPSEHLADEGAVPDFVPLETGEANFVKLHNGDVLVAA